MTIYETITDLAIARQKADEAKQAYETELAKHPKLAELEAAKKEASNAAKEFEDQLRSQAIDEFTKTENKQILDGAVTIAESQDYIYDEYAVKKWALENMRFLLVLDNERFKKLLRSEILNPDEIPVSVKAETKLTAKIKRDLSDFVSAKAIEARS